MPDININNLVKEYNTVGEDLTAVRDVGLSIQNNEFFVLVGPSGCGKTTILRLIAGLEDVTSGTITFGDSEVTTDRARERNVSMVFQEHALYPHFTVRENISFGLRISTTLSSTDINKKVEETATILDIKPLLDQYPNSLSGGQQQRVALGRAIVRDPEVFLLDEPLSSLDAQLRDDMRAEIMELHRKISVTTVYVTHDQREAMAMGDRIGVMKDGEIEQVGTVEDIYQNPENTFVASFIGSPTMNIFTVDISTSSGDYIELTTDGKVITGIPIRAAPDKIKSYERITIGIRPEHIILTGEHDNDIDTTVSSIENQGRERILRLSPEFEKMEEIVAVTSTKDIERNEQITLGFDIDYITFFDPDTGRVI